MVGTGPVLSFSLTPATEGSYTCQASVTGYTPLRKQTQVTHCYYKAQIVKTPLQLAHFLPN